MTFLLPHRYKKTGIVIAPAGLTLWILMQRGYILKMLVFGFGAPSVAGEAAYHIVEVVAAVTGFFCFLAGIYFLAFSREKVDDEMVQRIRLESFLFAAAVQIIFLIAGFLWMLFAGDPAESGMMVFFIALIALFWLSFIARFNYVLHFKYWR
ncbi:MAG TPA: hypothetical protein VF145_11970 [Chitinophagaceae bacterium]